MFQYVIDSVEFTLSFVHKTSLGKETTGRIAQLRVAPAPRMPTQRITIPLTEHYQYVANRNLTNLT